MPFSSLRSLFSHSFQSQKFTCSPHFCDTKPTFSCSLCRFFASWNGLFPANKSRIKLKNWKRKETNKTVMTGSDTGGFLSSYATLLPSFFLFYFDYGRCLLWIWNWIQKCNRVSHGLLYRRNVDVVIYKQSCNLHVASFLTIWVSICLWIIPYLNPHEIIFRLCLKLWF